MSLFARSFYDSDPSFTPLFRLLDEFDNYTREARGTNNERRGHRGRHHTSVFHPRFDIRETDSAYELHGELPGIERDKINIEFTDPQTLVIRGRTERTYSSGNPPAGLVESGAQPAGAITEKGEKHAAASGNESGGNGDESNGADKAKAPFEKYWVQERSVGEFARTFSFPSRVDQDAVSASLTNGILSLIVPKAKKHEARRIAIN
jgi:HSP20 family molecular chaperone IbpA